MVTSSGTFVRQGHEEPINAPARAYAYPRVSPDGTRVALDIRDQDNDIWIWDFAREALTQLTFEATADRLPVWTPDGRRILFNSSRTGPANLFWQAADGTGAAERLTQSKNEQFPTTISPDGSRLAFYEAGTTTDVMTLTLDTRRVQPLLQTPADERNAEISPDGRWVAYQSNETGQYEIYVRPFPDVSGGKWRVSTGGGTRPLWSRDVLELFYVTPIGQLMGLRVRREPMWAAGTPTKILEGQYFFGGGAFAGRTYDVAADGRRFLMIKAAGGSGQAAVPTSLVVVQNWFEELKRLVPTR